MPAHNFLACDLGAESGRVMLGAISSADGRLTLEELHRFPNEPVQLPTGLFWDAFRLFHEIQRGLAVAGRARRLDVAGIAVDTWGVDFGLIGCDGTLVDNPRHYRDARNNGIMERTFAVVPREVLFAETGIQFMQFNSVFQLYAGKLAGSPGLAAADKLLFMPDLFNYWLTGERAAELTIASTSQFYNPRERRWSTELFERLDLPARILPDIIEPGRRLGSLLPHVQESTGLRETAVYTTASHDTAAAVAAVPARGEDWCYISSGTWSLMGVELEAPLIDERSLAENLTNEVGYGGRIRLLKNIAGLWLVQECRRAWAAAGQEYSYAELTEMAADAPAYGAYIDPDQFLEPGHMPEKIAAHCRRHALPVPENPAAMIRAILESLAERYRQVLVALESLTGRRINTVHIVGGGSKNRLLNQLVADVTGRIVVAGPGEATAAGNVLVQAIGAGLLRDLEQARELVRRSFEVETFEPRRAGARA
jgi:rhamnulokinase